jgi:hypothetical protein
MKHIIFGILLFAIYQHNFAQNPTIIVDKTGSVHPWSHLEVNNEPENFQFAIVTDRTGGHRPGVFEDAVHKLNLLQPEFVMSVGDLIEGYTRDKDEIYRQWDEFNSFIDKLEMPFFYVPGNHDYINNVMAEIWKEKYGKSYYHFIYKDVLFLCLNSEEATKGSNLGGIEKPQYDYVKKVLEENAEVRWTLVFMHQPLWILDNTRYWPDIENLLKDRKHTVFVGHHHHYVKYERNNGKYFILATTGGASKLRGADYGEFDHVVWITMTKEGPIMANLMLEGIWDENIVDEDIYRMISISPLQFEPLVIDRFAKGVYKVRVKITNDENVPLEASMKIHELDNYIAEKQTVTKLVNPNSIEIMELELESIAELASELQPFHIDAEFAYQLNNGRDIIIKQSYNFSPSIKHQLKSSGKDIQIDGKLNEWEGEGITVNHNNANISGTWEHYSNDEDLNIHFFTDYDEDFLYVAVDVEDDVLMLDPEKSVWRQDAVRIYIDSRTALKSIMGTEQNNGKDYLGFFISPPADGKSDIVVEQPDVFPEGTKYAATTNANKICYEVAIPISWIVQNAGENWKSIRINVGVTDVDAYQSTSRIFWMPEWRSEANVIGSGLFFK